MPEGTKAHPKGHKLAPIGLHFYYGYFLIVAKTDKYVYKVDVDMEVSEDWGDGQQTQHMCDRQFQLWLATGKPSDSSLLHRIVHVTQIIHLLHPIDVFTIYNWIRAVKCI